MRKENVFLNQGEYMVTTTRFEVPGQTFVMAGVTSVRVAKDVPSKVRPILTLILGVLFLVSAVETGVSSALCGLILLLVGGLWLWSKKTVYYIILLTAGGEQRATTSTNVAFMESLRAALTNAIIDRG